MVDRGAEPIAANGGGGGSDGAAIVCDCVHSCTCTQSIDDVGCICTTAAICKPPLDVCANIFVDEFIELSGDINILID